MSSGSKTCGVCCEAFTKFVRKPVACLSCPYEACVKCYQTYLTSNPNTECMSCHAPWTREFIDESFPKSWVRGAYMTFREGVLLDMEKAQLPGSQYLVRNYRMVQEIQKQLNEEYMEKERMKKRWRDIEINKWNLEQRTRRIRASRFHSDGLGGEGESRERRSFVRACPVDGCRGFLSSALKCGTCDHYACGECFGCVGVDRNAEHTCDPGDIETAKYIKQQSRPCPTCAVNISKIDGCDQMYCVLCRTAFSWRTGSVVQGTIHNPHYFEMLRAIADGGDIPRQPGDEGGDGGCPQEVTDPGRLTMRLYDALSENGFKRGPVYDTILNAQRHACHLFRDTIPTIDTHPTDTSDLRMRYLLREIDEATFKRKLVLRENAIEKQTALVSCYRAKVQSTIDTLMLYIRKEIKEDELLTRLRAIYDMSHTFLCRISSRFSSCSVEFGIQPKLFDELQLM